MTVVAILMAGLVGQLVLADSDSQQPNSWQQRRQIPLVDAAQNMERAESGTVVKRVREGTVLSHELAVFEMSGDRITVQLAEYPEPLRVLENLALERVWKMMDESRDREWSVSGTVTEYRGQNFLLLSRAVLRSRPAAVSHQ